MATVGNELLEEYDNAWNHKTRKSRERAKAIAATWVAANQDFLFQYLGDKSRSELVLMVDGYRHIGNEKDRIAVDMWLMVHHDPHPVVGVLKIDPASVVRAAAEVLIHDLHLVQEDEDDLQPA